MCSTHHSSGTWQSIEALLDRLDPSPSATCDVEGCIHLHHESFVSVGDGTV